MRRFFTGAATPRKSDGGGAPSLPWEHEGRCRAVVRQPLSNTHASAAEAGGKGSQVVDLAEEANGVINEDRFELEDGFFRQVDRICRIEAERRKTAKGSPKCERSESIYRRA
jgi:hypothetical protein